MPVCLYFQLHQPQRLRHFSIFDEESAYFDDARNEQICRKVADKCYRPATRLLLDLCRRHKGAFRVTFSITGVALEQLERWAPDVVELFRQLAQSGCCEFLAETYHHSLAFFHSHPEFLEQVNLHSRKIQALFGQTPTVFRNTELTYDNELASVVAGLVDTSGRARFRGCLAEGVDALLIGRSPCGVYQPPQRPEARDGQPFGVLLRHYRLSDDIAFRFGDRSWPEWPLSAERFARSIRGEIARQAGGGRAGACNLFMDFETFGEHQWADTGIFTFLSELPDAVLNPPGGAAEADRFVTASQALREFDPVGVYDAPAPTSWADTARDLSAWSGNAMQRGATAELYRLEAPIKATRDQGLLDDWRRLTTSDHAYYMSTKGLGGPDAAARADGQVHQYFSPYESPYDAYINFMNVLDHLRRRAEVCVGAGV